MKHYLLCVLSLGLFFQTGSTSLRAEEATPILVGLDSTTLSGSGSVLPPAGLTVMVSGEGTVTPDLTSKTLVEGRRYAITATPKAGWLFAGWSGNSTSSTPSLSFVYASGQSFLATFVTNAFKPLAGSYNGLFYETKNVQHATSGSLNLALTRGGAFDATLRCGGREYLFSGRLDPVAGTFAKTLAPKSKYPLTVTLALDLTGTTDQILGTVAGTNWVADLICDKKTAYLTAANTNVCPLFGKYTMAIPPDVTPSSPVGYSYAAIKIDRYGNVAIAGLLADRTPLSLDAALSKNGTFPLYVPLYEGKGSAIGWLNVVTTPPPSQLVGTVSWIKPTLKGSRFYKDGFTNQVAVLGSSYIRSNGVPMLTNANFTMTLTSGNLTNGPLYLDVLLRSNNTFKVADTNATKKVQAAMMVRQGDGTLSAGFYHPVSHDASEMWGIVLQRQEIYLGFFKGPSTLGSVRVVPTSWSGK